MQQEHLENNTFIAQSQNLITLLRIGFRIPSGCTCSIHYFPTSVAPLKCECAPQVETQSQLLILLSDTLPASQHPSVLHITCELMQVCHKGSKVSFSD